MSAPRAGTVYLVPNLLGAIAPQAVLPARTIDIARRLRRFVVEAPKPARAFVKSLASHYPLSEIDFAVLDQHTPRRRIAELLAPALAGEDLGVLSDAGCPGVADPGALLVAAAHDAGIAVAPLVGPSAPLLALMASGMNGQSFAFHGYLPVRADLRAAALKRLDGQAQQSGTTQIFIETPYRNAAIVAAALEVCRRETRFCVAADLTLPTEQVVSRRIAAWRAAPPIDWSKRPAMFLLGRD
ncbi:MAG TPA: SAM-dependent methyltransferase [Casimicrobiaceae bacterium]|nr:SAM-dependent methyltransferase [Casimicrobiaceae bacterium]